MRRLRAFSFVLACLLTLTACGCGDPELPAGDVPLLTEDEADDALYDLGEILAALPARYVDQLLVVTDFPGAEESYLPLISVYEKASYEAAQAEYGGGGGFLFGFLAMDRAAFEQHITAGADGSGITVIARDGERFYAYTYPTDVQFCRPGGEIDTESEDWKAWERLCAIGPEVREDFIARNRLTPYSVEEFLSQPFTYEGDHAYVRFSANGGGQVYDTLVLSQPVRQGEGGLWCVERWMTPMGDICPYFPDSGSPAAEYYAGLQARCDAGELPELLAPLGAARRFVEESGRFQTEGLGSRFELTEGYPTAYAEANSRLAQLVRDVQLGNADSGGLLDCVGRLSPENWVVLEEYALPPGTWWGPLLAALESAAVGANQRERDRNMIACALSLPEAWADRQAGLSDILRAQRKADPEAFSGALSEFPEDARLSLTVQITFGSNESNSDVPELVEPIEPGT